MKKGRISVLFFVFSLQKRVFYVKYNEMGKIYPFHQKSTKRTVRADEREQEEDRSAPL